MNISRLRKPLFPLLSISAALLISVLTLYAHYWLIPLYEMCKTDHIVNEVGTIARVSTTFVTEPERHRQKYTVLSLQNGQNLYIYHDLVAYFEKSHSAVNSLLNSQVLVSYLQRDTFGDHGYVLVSLHIDDKGIFTLEDTAHVFWNHIKSPIHTCTITLIVLWTAYFSLCIFVWLHQKRTRKVRKKHPR